MRNVYSRVTFGPELPPGWNGEDEGHRALRAFIGLPANANRSSGTYCASKTDARGYAKTYDLYLRWSRGDQSVLAETLCEAIAMVVGIKIDRRL